jgi:hypothetical protein
MEADAVSPAARDLSATDCWPLRVVIVMSAEKAELSIRT